MQPRHHVTDQSASLGDRVRMVPLYAMPHHLLSALMRVATRIRFRVWKHWQMRWFIRRYQVDMALAERNEITVYEHFNDFFTRALKPEVRPVCEDLHDVACPADGTVSAFGALHEDTIVQAKGMHYSLCELLGGDEQRALPFRGGHFATIYLSPRDYHRVHMPLSGDLTEMVHTPGRLFSVNPVSVRTVPRLFARNERVVCVFDTAYGPMALVLVGAVFVGSIETVWAGEVAPRAERDATVVRYPLQGDSIVHLERGQEMGRFNMGSTVIVVLPAGPLSWREGLASGVPTQMGQTLASLG